MDGFNIGFSPPDCTPRIPEEAIAAAMYAVGELQTRQVEAVGTALAMADRDVKRVQRKLKSGTTKALSSAKQQLGSFIGRIEDGMDHALTEARVQLAQLVAGRPELGAIQLPEQAPPDLRPGATESSFHPPDSSPQAIPSLPSPPLAGGVPPAGPCGNWFVVIRCPDTRNPQRVTYGGSFHIGYSGGPSQLRSMVQAPCVAASVIRLSDDYAEAREQANAIAAQYGMAYSDVTWGQCGPSEAPPNGGGDDTIGNGDGDSGKCCPVNPSSPIPSESGECSECYDCPQVDPRDIRWTGRIPWGKAKGKDSWVGSECGERWLWEQFAQYEPIGRIADAMGGSGFTGLDNSGGSGPWDSKVFDGLRPEFTEECPTDWKQYRCDLMEKE